MKKSDKDAAGIVEAIRKSDVGKVKVAVSDIDGVLRGKYLHRDSWFAFFLQLPGWIHSDVIHEPDGWITRKASTVGYQGDFPKLGKWPKLYRWKTQKVLSRASIKLPCVLRIDLGKYIHFEWYVPTTVGHHRYLQTVVKHTRGLTLLFRLRYWAYIR